MDPKPPNRNLIIFGIAALALVSSLIGVMVGGGLVSLWRFKGDRPTPAPAGCVTDPKLMARLEELSSNSASVKDEVAALRDQNVELAAQLAALAGDTLGPRSKGIHESLPPPYVDKVDDFFRTAGARALLSPAAAKDPSLVFGQPIFIYPDTITVPYKFSENYQYLLVKITILDDLYELQFDVIWDSIEGAR